MGHAGLAQIEPNRAHAFVDGPDPTRHGNETGRVVMAPWA
jgi:hypothetical protein